MQLTGPRGTLRASLMSASCALLGSAVEPAHADAGAPALDGWQSDSALLYYQEADGRVQALEPVVALQRDFGDEHVLSLKLTYDALSGGSPNGALPSASPQTFAAPSGAGPGAGGGPSAQHTVAPGALPLSKFEDQRAALSLGWSQPLGRSWKYGVGADVSHEHDFTSAGVNAALARDFFQRNTTLSLGGAFESDRIQPIGGTPVAGSDYALAQRTGNQSKTVASALLGVTQVMTRRWLLQLNLSADRSQGYQTDPYKIASVLDAAGNTIAYQHERRPDQRTRWSAYLENRLALGRDTLALALRYLQDDWGIRSGTADLRYRLELRNGVYLEPHGRYYRQSAADFYRLYLPATTTLPPFFSADPRLAAFRGVTAGLKLGIPLHGDAELALRVETYRQTGRDVAPGFGQIAGLDLYPGLRASIAQFSLRY